MRRLLFAAGACCAASAAALAQPANNDCSSAASFPIPPGGGTVTGTTVGATNDGGTPSCGGSGGRDVYHTFTPNSSGPWTLSLCGSDPDWDSVLSVHTNACPTGGSATQVAGGCNDDFCGLFSNSQISNLTLVAGTTYIVRVATYSSAETPGAYTLLVSPPVGNDECAPVLALTDTAGPFAFAGSGFTVSGSTVSASTSTGTSLGDCGQIGGSGNNPTVKNDLYYKFTPSISASFNITLCSSATNWDSVLSLHAGCPASATNQVVCNDDGTCSGDVGLSAISNQPLDAGTPYIIRVATFTAGTPSSFVLNVSSDPVGTCCTGTGVCSLTTAAGCSGGTFSSGATCAANPCPVSNDTCQTALTVTSFPYSSPQIALAGATADLDVSCNATAAAALNNGVWFTFTPSTTGSLAFGQTSGPDTATAIFTGTCDALTEIQCSDPASFSVSVTAGVQYYVLVGGWSSDPTSGTLVLTIDPIAGVTNDDCGTAIPITTSPYTSPGIVIAGANPDQDVACNSTSATALNNGVWFSYTASATGTVALNQTSGPDTSTAVFTGACGSLTEIACSDPASFSFQATAGTQYFILVGAYSSTPSGSTTPMVLTLEAITSIPNDDCATATVITSAPFTDSFEVRRAGTDAVDVSCNSTSATGTVNSAWYTYTPTGTTFGTFADDDGFDTVIAAFTGTCGSLTEIACIDEPQSLSLTLASGTQYYFMIGRYSSTPSTSSALIAVSFTTSAIPPAPGNDACTAATVISSLPFTSGNIANAGAAPDVNGSCNTSGATQVNNGIWFSHTPSQNCNYILQETTAQDAIFVVFIGDCSSPLEAYCSVSDNDAGTFAATAGTRYLILVGSQGTTPAGSSSALNVTIDCRPAPTAAPSNDLCASATTISSFPFDSGAIDIFLATDDDPITCNADGDTTTPVAARQGVWFSYTPSSDCVLSLNESGPLDTVKTIFTGACGALTPVSCVDAEASTFGVTAGTQYFILISLWDNTDTAATFDAYRLQANCVPSPSNDLCSNATPVSVGSVVTGGIATATGTPESDCTIASLDVWYVLTASSSGAYTFTGTVPGGGSSDATALGVFDACGGTEIDCSNPGTAAPVELTVNLTSGQTVYLRVARFADLTSPDGNGSFTISVTGPASANSVCCRGTTSILTTSAACTAPAGVGVTFLSGTSTTNGTSNTSPCCYADFNKDGSRNIDDIFIYLNAWFNTASNPFTKLNGDGVANANIDDLFIFINVWFAGGCG